MKKLIFAAAAVAGMGAFALESANIVGYSTTTVRSGYTLLIPSFDDVGSEGLDIQKIVPNTTAKGVNIQTFTTSAESDQVYHYVPTGKAGAGWYTSSRGTADSYAKRTFAKGEGFMAYFPSEDISLNISGEVTLTEKKLENVRQGYTLMGNFRPTSYSIQKIVPDTTAKGVNIQTFTTSAESDKVYHYVPTGKAGAGWYTSSRGTADTYANVTLEPGEGFMIYLPSSMNVTFQAAE